MRAFAMSDFGATPSWPTCRSPCPSRARCWSPPT